MLSFNTIMKRNSFTISVRTIYQRRIGNRDIVGHGCNGMSVYKDDAHFPFPAIRFKENTPEVMALREKEKGDWKQLTKTEKQALYRASFCQTFSEFQHNTGTWKIILGGIFFTTSFTFWFQMFNHFYVHEPLPHTLTEEAQRKTLQTIIDLHVNPIDGITSKWDYDKNQWKS